MFNCWCHLEIWESHCTYWCLLHQPKKFSNVLLQAKYTTSSKVWHSFSNNDGSIPLYKAQNILWKYHSIISKHTPLHTSSEVCYTVYCNCIQIDTQIEGMMNRGWKNTAEWERKMQQVLLLWKNKCFGPDLKELGEGFCWRKGKVFDVELEGPKMEKAWEETVKVW